MKLIYSLRFKLSALYLVTIIIPTVILSFSMPRYYQHTISKETEVLTEGSLDLLTQNILIYLEDLDRLTYAPYLNQRLLESLAVKSSSRYESLDYYTKKETLDEIDNMLSYNLEMARYDIVSALLIARDGTPFVSCGKWQNIALKKNYAYTDQKWFQDAVAADGKAAFISSHPQDYLSTPLASQVFSVARLIKDPVTQDNLAVVMADADTVVLKQILNKVTFNVSSIVSIFDEKNNLIYSTRSLSPEMITQTLNRAPVVREKRESYVLVSRSVNRANWSMAVLFSHSELMSKFRLIYVIGILFAAGELLLAFSLFCILSQIITGPFKEMMQAMKEVEKGNLEVSLTLKGNDEISRLGRALNQMVKRLQELIDKEYRAELSKRNAEYHALQSQIQPHFLYNTLNGLIGLNRLGRRDDLEAAILSLTGMLRYTLEHGDWTTVAEEFLLLQMYCDLQKLRFEDRLEFHIEYTEEASGVRIPKLLLQPLVENSIIHGAEPLKRKVCITVFAGIESREDIEYLKITVEDDGTGFNMYELSGRSPIGLSNVRERLQLAYHTACLVVNSRIGSGTQVLITIPVKDVKP